MRYVWLGVRVHCTNQAQTSGKACTAVGGKVRGGREGERKASEIEEKRAGSIEESDAGVKHRQHQSNANTEAET